MVYCPPPDHFIDFYRIPIRGGMGWFIVLTRVSPATIDAHIEVQLCRVGCDPHAEMLMLASASSSTSALDSIAVSASASTSASTFASNFLNLMYKVMLLHLN